MGYDFNADDVLEVAEQLERNGAAFYRDAAQRVEDPANKEFLTDLAVMEDSHEGTFKAMRAELKGKEKDATVFDPEGEAGLYLQALADTRVFFEKQIDTSTMEGILKAAIQAEKDSIVFYLGMKDVVPPALGSDKVDAIIREERGHLTLLSRRLMDLKK